MYLKHFETNFDPLILAQFPSRRLRTIVGHPTLMLYASVGQEFAIYLKLMTSLKPHHKVLDIGCGCGRIGGFLLSTVKAPGAYDGFDVVPDLIDDAQKRLGSLNPCFNFKTVDVYNKLYNPSPFAPKDSDLVFPYADANYDLTLLTSVFTHMIPAGLKNYVSQISRVTKKGGKCFCTMFLFQNMPEKAGLWELSSLKRGLKLMSAEEDSEYFKVNNRDRAEDMICYDLEYIDGIFKRNGMTRVSEPRYGCWSGNPDFVSYQDIVIYEKA
jgi:SAM-dependent methyltransferase